ncbi:MAG TPA: catalase [Candidatus Dorea intestinavium]|nr:catalase [Candidatus Dorea intestinavium]
MDNMDNKKNKNLTNAVGAPIADNTNSLTAGERGPLTMQNPWFIEKMAHFDREVIPERRMHAKGSGAFGTFTVTHDISRFTKANIFSKVGKQTEMFVRFSTVAGERGAADDERDIRGFALKFYTDEGNWDLVGNNTPVFFLRDPLRFPDLNHAVKRDPKTNMRSPQNNWDFWSMLPEALHQVTITMSDRGIPYSFRHMHGFGSHTYSMINDRDERTWVKFHWRTEQGIKNLTDQEAAAIVATDRENNQRDLFESIEKGDFPKWKMYIQVMTEEQANNYKENPFDITKVWSQKEFPLIPVGMFELNRNPENYFADVEQAAFNPANIIPGIGFSPDKLLQGRLFSYGDAQRYRLGVNHNLIPVNAPKCPYHAYHRDGQMRTDGNYGATTHYEPNSYNEWAEQPSYKEPPLDLEGPLMAYEPKNDKTDNTFYQPGDLYRLITEDKKAVLIENTVRNMDGVTNNVRYRHCAHCYLADTDYGTRLADGLKLDLDKVIELSKLSHDERMKATSLA